MAKISITIEDLPDDSMTIFYDADPETPEADSFEKLSDFAKALTPAQFMGRMVHARLLDDLKKLHDIHRMIMSGEWDDEDLDKIMEED